MSDIDQLIAAAAARHGIPVEELRRYVQVESNFNPNAKTGSYKGLLQLSDSEFKKHGGKGNIFDPAQNLNAGAAKLAAERSMFANKYGRPPTPGELYLIHQQGWGGLQAHLANPDRPAWQSMASTGEGRAKGEKWAKLAISGNIPQQWGVDPETITSGEFVRRWSERAGGTPAPQGSAVAQTGTAPQPIAASPTEVSGAPPALPPTIPEDTASGAIARALAAIQDAIPTTGSSKPIVSQAAPTMDQKIAMAVLQSRPVATLVPALNKTKL